VHVSDLTVEEAAELGPLLQRVAQVIQTLATADQVYVCLWSHAGWQPVHIHFVLQPAWNSQAERYSGPGPSLQVSMFAARDLLDPRAVQEFCDRARRALGPEMPGATAG
jgi:diadenosine tetraphosphate (Ap4A) HIT family hydrolase